jgi:copper-containing nitrite reductase
MTAWLAGCSGKSTGGAGPALAASTAAAPSDLYPIISPLVGGNAYSTAHANDYDITRDPNEVPASPLADGASVTFTPLEVSTFIAPANPSASPPVWAGSTDVKFNFMAFGATTTDPSVPAGAWLPRVPGPFLKVVANRTVNVTLKNPSSSMMAHSIDFHAVVGDKGGAAMLMAQPGETATLAIKPTHPGLFVYHCAEAGTPEGIAEHMNAGMYGLMLVLPGDAQGNLLPTDPFSAVLAAGVTEHYVFEGDVYEDAQGNFDEVKELNTLVPDYVTFNGRVSGLVDHPLMGSAAAGGYIVYFASAGSHIPSFHIIGAVFDDVWDQGDITSVPLHDLQTTLVPSAGSVAVEIQGANLVVNAGPGGSGINLQNINILVDHASFYFRKGALGFMVVTP